MRFIFGSVAVHFQECCGPLLFKKSWKKTTKTFARKFMFDQKKSWSSLDCLLQCGFPFEAVRSYVRWKVYSLGQRAYKINKYKKYNKYTWGSLLVLLRFTFESVVVHSRSEKSWKKTTKTCARKFMFDKKKSWSSLDCLLQCGFQFEAVRSSVRRRFWCHEKKTVSAFC